MKINFISYVFIVLFSCKSIGQIGIGTKNPHSDAMLEISSNNKGLLLPRVALKSTLSAFPLQSHVAGMCVFNSATTGDVTLGYYYNNGSKWIKLLVDEDILITTEDIANNAITIPKLPPGATNTTFLRGDGTWSNVSSSIDITTTEVVLPYKIDGKQLYAIKGSFTANGSSVTVTITAPSGMTGYYSFTSYKDGRTFRRDIISFDISLPSNNVVTGSGFIAEAYPAGQYNYVLEYFK